MSERGIREAMREVPVPDEEAAQRRAWRVLHAAFEQDRADGGRGSRPRPAARPLLALAALAVVIAAALTPAGEAVGDWIADGLRTRSTPALPALTSLPTAGRVLVTSGQGPWVVQPDGSRRRLGDYSEAGWSPNGLFVVASRGRQLAALEPDGSVRWTLARSAPVSDATWSPDGFRVAYRSGSMLRVVAGDGTADTGLASAADVSPAWRPGKGHALAYVDRSGAIAVRQTDTGRGLWRARVSGRPTQLLWNGDGSRLVVVSPGGLVVLAGDGRAVSRMALPAGMRASAAAINPVDGTLALVRHRRAGDRSEVVSLSLPEDEIQRPRRLFAGKGSFGDLAWSPDGRWLLLAWRDADQWLFIRSAEVRRVRAVANITAQFNPGGAGSAAFPEVSGWCCAQR